MGCRLAGCLAADDAVLTASEMTANAVAHSQKAGEFFTVRCEVHADHVWVECEGLGKAGASSGGLGDSGVVMSSALDRLHPVVVHHIVNTLGLAVASGAARGGRRAGA